MLKVVICEMPCIAVLTHAIRPCGCALRVHCAESTAKKQREESSCGGNQKPVTRRGAHLSVKSVETEQFLFFSRCRLTVDVAPLWKTKTSN
jgi:hypothetical protein